MPKIFSCDMNSVLSGAMAVRRSEKYAASLSEIECWNSLIPELSALSSTNVVHVSLYFLISHFTFSWLAGYFVSLTSPFIWNGLPPSWIDEYVGIRITAVITLSPSSFFSTSSSGMEMSSLLSASTGSSSLSLSSFKRSASSEIISSSLFTMSLSSDGLLSGRPVLPLSPESPLSPLFPVFPSS